MQNPKFIIPFTLAFGTLIFSQANGQEQKQGKSAELKVLDRFVGAWHGKTVSTDASGKETTLEDHAKMRWILGESYIEDRIGDTLYGLWTYDTEDEVYRAWYFLPGSHKPTVFTMKWNPEQTAFAGSSDLDNGFTMTTKHQFIGKDKFEWQAVVKDASGKVVAKHEGTKTRKSSK